MGLREWLGRRDRDYSALRRAARTAIVMPGLFAVADLVIGNADVATFAAFGAFAMLLLVDFGGPLHARLQAQAALVLAGAVLVCLGTLASAVTWLAATAMAVVGFAVLFAGAVSSVLASASTALLLAFILPVSVASPVSSLPGRLAGWGMAGAASILAVGLAWPAPAREPLRGAAATACRALAARLRAEAGYLRAAGTSLVSAADRDRAVSRAEEAAEALRHAFLATPYRPTGLGTASRMIVRLVAEVGWVNTLIGHEGEPRPAAAVNQPVCAVKLACAAVLERGARLLAVTAGSGDDLRAAFGQLKDALAELADQATATLPTGVSSLDPAFRAQEIGFGVGLLARHIELVAAAERRSWTQRVLGRQPEGALSLLAAAQVSAAAHAERHSVWLRNSVRGAAGLGLAVLAARLTGLQHSFWVVLGTLSVLRSNALSTGQDVVRALAGTVAGLAIGAGLIEAIGTNITALWLILPVAVLLAGIAPAAISFAGGQAAFTLTLVILFNIIAPAGWQVGLLRLEDVALGCAVSLVTGLLLWPAGAGAVLRTALAEAYADGAAYLASAVDFAAGAPATAGAPAEQAAAVQAAAGRATAAVVRLDNAFRAYLAERGPKPVPLADVTRLVTGASALVLAGDGVVGLWMRQKGRPWDDRMAVRRELLGAATRVRGWYDGLAASLASGREPGEPLGDDRVADGRLAEAARRDLNHAGAGAAATAVRVVWTGDHLDAARRLQAAIAPAARSAARSAR